ncbi:MAG: XdhC family protein [Treponema sp.]|jgi:xanthine dehydrogenase accessory factor|nr:XdhC family protein [Treponema sp.]
MKDLFLRIEDRLGKGESLVLAVIVDASGSTPRGPGAVMLVGGEGRLWGTIGGAVPEYLAIEEGKKLLEKKRSALKTYMLHPGEAADIGAKCGGEMSVFLLFLDGGNARLRSVITAGIGGFARPEPEWFVFSLEKTASSIGFAGKAGITAWAGEKPEDSAALLKPRPGRKRQGKKNWFALPVAEEGFVYIFGGGHVAQALAPLLCRLDFRCIVFDDREEFTGPELFPPDCGIIRGDFEHIGASLTLTEKDYAVVVTRGHAFDFQAGAFALRSAVPYIGVIGSRTKQDFLRGRLKDAGFTREELDAPRIHAPIGIDIQSKTPAEVAVSIAAELILVRARAR